MPVHRYIEGSVPNFAQSSVDLQEGEKVQSHES